MYYARSFHDESGAFRETGALRFLFYPEGRTYSPPSHRPGGGSLPVGQAVRSARRIALSSESASQCCRDCDPGHHCLRGGIGAPIPPPAKTCTRQLCRRGRANQKVSPCFLFCERETEKRLEVRTIGNLPFGGEGHQPWRRTLGLRGLGLYELLRHL